MFRIDSLIVDRHFLPLKRLADDGQQRAGVFGEADWLVDAILEQLALVFGHCHGDHAFFEPTYFHLVGDGFCCRGTGPLACKTLGHLTEQALLLHVAAGWRGCHRFEFIHGVPVRLRPEIGVELWLDNRTWIIEWLIQIHREGYRPSRDQSEFYVVPVL